MDCFHSSVENVLEKALRTYEESERSLKSICNSVEEENNELEDQLRNLQAHHTTLIKQYHSIKESLHQIRGEHARLAERQLVIDQQTKQIHQRYEQVKHALKKIVFIANLTNEDFSDETFSMLGFKLIRIDEERRLTNDIGTDYDPPTCLSSKRKLNHQNTKPMNQFDNHPIDISIENILDDSINEECSYDKDPLSFSNNESHSNLFSNDIPMPIINCQSSQFKAQRQLDEDDIPPPDLKLDEILIHSNREANTEQQVSLNDDYRLKTFETLHENKTENNFNQDESAVDETNDSATESKSNANDNNSSIDFHKLNIDHQESDQPEDESTSNKTNNSSTESRTNTTDESDLNQSETTNDNDIKNENSFILDTSKVDQIENSTIELENNFIGNNVTSDSSIEEEKQNNLNVHTLEESTDNQTNSYQQIGSVISDDSDDENENVSIKSNTDERLTTISDNHYLLEIETQNENNSQNDTSAVELIIDKINNTSNESQSYTVDDLPVDTSQKFNDENDSSSNELIIDQTTSNLSSELQSNLNEYSHLIETTVDQTENVSIEIPANTIEDLCSTELEQSTKNNDENDIQPVDTTMDQINSTSIEFETNLNENNSSIESEKENQDPNENKQTNVSLKSYSLPDVVSETLEENHKSHFENESIEQINNNHENYLADENSTENLIDNEKELELKSSTNSINQNEDEPKLPSQTEFEDILGNKSLLKQIKVKGQSDSHPTRSTMATVSYKLSIVDKLTSNIRLIENVSNENFFISECDIIGAIDICVPTMNRGECALIDCDVRHCYGDMGCREKQIPEISLNNPYRMLIELELHDWQSPHDIRNLSIDERLHWGDKKRQMGNFHYRRQDYFKSLQCYSGALRFLDTDLNPLLISFNENQRSILNDCFIQVENNVAQVNLLLNKYDACLNAVENVLKHDPKNVKALFRQGKAFFQLGSYDKAIQPLKLFMQIQKGNSSAAADKEKVNEMIQFCENKLANYQKNEKEIYQRMFRPKATTSPTSNQQRQTKDINQIETKSNSWWPYIALGSAVLTTLALVTFIKHRNVS